MNLPKRFTSPLLRWYQKNARDLPWRRTHHPYQIWISEVMLQQTTVNAVIPYYERWIREFPSMSSVAQAPLQKILKSWQGLGYYSRARNIHKAAKIFTRSFAGKIPADPEILKEMHGFGSYTTAAVLSIAFGLPIPVIDTNVRRVMQRILAIEKAGGSLWDRQLREALSRVMPLKEPGTFNQALMELGALICRSREPLCLLCPVRDGCRAFQKGLQSRIPLTKKVILKKVQAVIALIKVQEKYLIQRRPPKGLFAGLWEFPGGKIEKGESASQALVREVKEELGSAVVSAQKIFEVEHLYTQFRVNLQVFACRLKHLPLWDSRRRWVSLSALKKYPMPAGSARILSRLFENRQMQPHGF